MTLKLLSRGGLLALLPLAAIALVATTGPDAVDAMTRTDPKVPV